MSAWIPGFGVAVGALAMLVIMVIVITGHCTFNGSVGIGIH